uniref:ACP23D4c n=1 Tax=Drosophila teissieri TaxID=7243 RepID=Q45WG0_DROTE|nr:ACP23D4c [Drosophila teissieri]
MFKLAVILIYLLIAGCAHVHGWQSGCEAFCFSKMEGIMDYVEDMKEELAELRFLNSFEKIGSHYYYFEHWKETNWTTADEECRKMGARLAEIRDEREYNAILPRLQSNMYWLDITNRGQGDHWYSLNTGQPAAFLKWHQGGMDNEGFSVHCVTIFYDDMWDENCMNFNNYTCKLQK